MPSQAAIGSSPSCIRAQQRVLLGGVELAKRDAVRAPRLGLERRRPRRQASRSAAAGSRDSRRRDRRAIFSSIMRGERDRRPVWRLRHDAVAEGLKRPPFVRR